MEQDRARTKDRTESRTANGTEDMKQDRTGQDRDVGQEWSTKNLCYIIPVLHVCFPIFV